MSPHFTKLHLIFDPPLTPARCQLAPISNRQAARFVWEVSREYPIRFWCFPDQAACGWYRDRRAASASRARMIVWPDHHPAADPKRKTDVDGGREEKVSVLFSFRGRK